MNKFICLNPTTRLVRTRNAFFLISCELLCELITRFRNSINCGFLNRRVSVSYLLKSNWDKRLLTVSHQKWSALYKWTHPFRSIPKNQIAPFWADSSHSMQSPKIYDRFLIFCIFTFCGLIVFINFFPGCFRTINMLIIIAAVSGVLLVLQ